MCNTNFWAQNSVSKFGSNVGGKKAKNLKGASTEGIYFPARLLLCSEFYF